MSLNTRQRSVLITVKDNVYTVVTEAELGPGTYLSPVIDVYSDAATALAAAAFVLSPAWNGQAAPTPPTTHAANDAAVSTAGAHG